jgi:hypothetical protein
VLQLTHDLAQLGLVFAIIAACPAVFERVGGELPGRLAPLLPFNSTIYFYGTADQPGTGTAGLRRAVM